MANSLTSSGLVTNAVDGNFFSEAMWQYCVTISDSPNNSLPSGGQWGCLWGRCSETGSSWSYPSWMRHVWLVNLAGGTVPNDADGGGSTTYYSKLLRWRLY